MQLKNMKWAWFGEALVASMLAAGSAMAALQDRDLNGNGVIDAFCDSDLGITWLRDANVNRAMTWFVPRTQARVSRLRVPREL